MLDIRTIQVMQYITPLREGGSLPAIVSGCDGFMYALKFRGSGQGVKALIAELIGGMIAKQLELKLPEIVFATLDEAFGRTEPDQEIQDLLKKSRGLNLGLHYLSGAITYDPVTFKVNHLLASKIVWLDAFILNVDRTIRNTNLLVWNKELWLIDHGASLYFHHNWDNWQNSISSPFSMVKDHVLLPYASKLEEVDQWAKQILTDDFFKSLIQTIPAVWLENIEEAENAQAASQVYYQFLSERIQQTHHFLKAAIDARENII